MFEAQAALLKRLTEKRTASESTSMVRVCDLDTSKPVAFFQYIPEYVAKPGQRGKPYLSSEIVEWLDDSTPGYEMRRSENCSLCLDFHFASDDHAVLFQLRWR